MDKNYYDVLGLRRDTTQQEIANRYKQMVLRWHPKFAKEDQNTAQYHFSQISEAYEVLSDPLKRAFFDKHGWKKLKDGLFEDGELKGGYRFANNPDEIFQKFFLNNNIFGHSIEKKLLERGSLFSHSFGALNYANQNSNQNLVVPVYCRLEELYEGVAKNIQYERMVLNDDGRTLSSRKQQRLIQIKPGHGKQTNLVFKQQGNEDIDRKRTDLIFKIEEIPHAMYERKGNDLIYKAKISLESALQCEPIEITTLDNRHLLIGIDQIPNPNSVKQIENEGMPILGARGRRGLLVIKFDIEFPRKLREETRKQLRKLLE